MNCWNCGTELIWGDDNSMDEYNDGEESEYDFVTNLSCPNVMPTSKFIITNNVYLNY